ncbi:mas-related G-protein coupled receptor member H-like [Lissotriton helveticus]
MAALKRTPRIRADIVTLRKNYKLAVKTRQDYIKREAWENLLSAVVLKDSRQFWEIIKQPFFSDSTNDVMDCVISDDKWLAHFRKVYGDNETASQVRGTTCGTKGSSIKDHNTISPSSAEMEEYFEDRNTTDIDYAPQTSILLAQSYGLLFICLLGLVGNGITLWYLTVCISRTHFTTYILNLSIADFMFLLFFSFMIILLYLLPLHGFIVISFPFYIITFITAFGYQSSLYLLTAISVERCLSILYPIWYRCHRPSYQTTIVCIVLWAFSSMLAATETYFGFTNGISKEFAIFEAVLYFLILTPVILLSNLVLLNKICKKSQRRHGVRPSILILITVLTFLSLSVVICLITFLVVFDLLTMPPAYGMVCCYCFCINSSINPILYFLVGSLRRRGSKTTIKRALQKAFQDESQLTQDEAEDFPQQECLRMRSPL